MREKLIFKKKMIRDNNYLTKKNTILLEGRSHGTYEYPDLAVAFGINYRNRSYQRNERSLEQNNLFMLTIRQLEDFLQTLDNDRIYNANGDLIADSKTETCYIALLRKSILSMNNRSLYLGEMLDASFESRNGVTYVTYQRVTPDGKIKKVTEKLSACVDGVTEDFSFFNQQGFLSPEFAEHQIRIREENPLVDEPSSPCPYKGLEVKVPSSLEGNKRYAFYFPSTDRGIVLTEYNGNPRQNLGVRMATLRSNL